MALTASIAAARAVYAELLAFRLHPLIINKVVGPPAVLLVSFSRRPGIVPELTISSSAAVAKVIHTDPLLGGSAVVILVKGDSSCHSRPWPIGGARRWLLEYWPRP